MIITNEIHFICTEKCLALLNIVQKPDQMNIGLVK